MRAYTMPTPPQLIFSLHTSLYAVPASSVIKITGLPDLIPLPGSPPYIAGLVNLQGQVVPVIDINVRMGHTGHPLRIEDSLIILKINEAFLGIIINDVHQVRSIAPHEAEVLPEFLCEDGEAGARFVAGLAKIDDSVVILLSLDDLLRLPTEKFLAEELVAHPPGGQVAIEILGNAGASTGGGFFPHATPKERATLLARANKLRQPLSVGASDGLMPLAVVGLSGEYFGIDLSIVRRFSALKAVTPVPCCPDHVVGQMNLRGDILTVVDIRAALQMPRANFAGGPIAKRKVVVIQSDSLRAGIVVDEVLDIVNLQPTHILPVPTATARLRGEEYLKGVAPCSEGMMGILDLPRMFSQGSFMVSQEV